MSVLQSWISCDIALMMSAARIMAQVKTAEYLRFSGTQDSIRDRISQCFLVITILTESMTEGPRLPTSGT